MDELRPVICIDHGQASWKDTEAALSAGILGHLTDNSARVSGYVDSALLLPASGAEIELYYCT